MARKTDRPTWLHKSSGQARCRFNGREHRLGEYGSETSPIRYGQLVAQVAGGLTIDPLGNRGKIPRNETEPDSGPSVTELLLAFKTHAEGS